MKEELNKVKEESLHLAGLHYNLAGLRLLKYTSKQWSRFASQLVISAFIAVMLLFVSVGTAFILANVFNSMAFGFLAVGLFYLVVISILLAFRREMLVNPIRDLFIENIGEGINWYENEEVENSK